ncbi:MAG: Holliday junction resolvase RuvX [Metamycoplasmataceae bacterium]
MNRILAIDLGIKKSGIAISDPLQIIAQPFSLIKYEANDFSTLIKELEKIILEKSPIEKIILGYPLSLNNQENIMSKKVLEFKKILENKLNIEIILMDERFTSKQSTKIMQEMNMNNKKKKENRDIIAAQIILQNYLKIKLQN